MTVFQPKDWESGASAGITLARMVEEKMPKEYVLNFYKSVKYESLKFERTSYIVEKPDCTDSKQPFPVILDDKPIRNLHIFHTLPRELY
jgi:hypothetical protein